MATLREAPSICTVILRSPCPKFIISTVLKIFLGHLWARESSRNGNHRSWEQQILFQVRRRLHPRRGSWKRFERLETRRRWRRQWWWWRRRRRSRSQPGWRGSALWWLEEKKRKNEINMKLIIYKSLRKEEISLLQELLLCFYHVFCYNIFITTE